MDPGTGNIYTPEQAEALKLDFDKLIPLEDEEAAQLLEERRVHAEVIAEKHREWNATMRKDAKSRNKRHVRAKNKAARTARRGNRI